MKKIFISLIILLIVSCSNNKDTSEKKSVSEKQQIEVQQSAHKKDYEKNKKVELNGDYKIVVEKISPITKKEDGSFNNPVFSNNGNFVFFTNSSFSQIWVYDCKKKSYEKIIESQQAGANFQVSEDGNEIYFRTKDFRNTAGKTFSIMKYSLVKKELKTIYSSNDRISYPKLLDKKLYFQENNNPKSFNIKANKTDENFDPPFYFVQNNNLIKYNGSSESVRLNNKKLKFVNVNYTKDGQFIKALTKNNGVMLMNLKTEPINLYRNAITLSKLFNSNLVVFASEKNDGMKLTNSELFVGFLGSNRVIPITNSNSEQRFNPDWSPTENKIVYNNNEGVIKIISFKIENK
ncbi:MAG: hypothetical protein CR986_07260 [Ignavibacteriae bacterium]|nr:MAG: hypothetical protein CR986_07260 [Ignavibacteriota bacterium]